MNLRIPPTLFFVQALFICSLYLSNHVVFADMYMNDPHVVELNPTTFESMVMKNEHTAIVKFYAPWCQHCVNLHSSYSKAAEKLKSKAVVAAIDCTKHGQLCQKYGVRGYPTLKLFYSQPKLTKRLQKEYNGARSLDAIVKFIKDSIPNHVKSLGTGEKQMTMDAFYQLKNDTLPKVLITKPKASTTNPQIIYFATEYRFRLLFGEHVDPKYDESALYVIPLNGNPVKYSDELKIEKLQPFLAKYASKKKVEAPVPKPREEL